MQFFIVMRLDESWGMPLLLRLLGIIERLPNSVNFLLNR